MSPRRLGPRWRASPGGFTAASSADPLAHAAAYATELGTRVEDLGINAARRKVGVSFVTDSESCRRALRALPPSAFPVLLQRRLSGLGEGRFLFAGTVAPWLYSRIAACAKSRRREGSACTARA